MPIAGDTGLICVPHITVEKLPKTISEPLKAQDTSERMSLGVMASWHWFGRAPRGMTELNWADQNHDLIEDRARGTTHQQY